MHKATASHRDKPTAFRREAPARSSSRRADPPPRREVEITRAAASWIADGRAQLWSEATILDRQKTIERFCWWLEHEAQLRPVLSALNPDVIREFLAYAAAPCETGRYGSDRASAQRKARPATVNAYFRILRALTNFCLAEGLLTESPLKNIRAPKIPKDQIQPFSEEQVQALLDAARRGLTPDRDAAIMLLLVDTGMRVSELCGLVMSDIDRGSGELRVLGKGNKERTIHMGVKARRALWRHLEANRRRAEPSEPLFTSFRGHTHGSALGISGVEQMIHNAGERANIPSSIRCSPHTFRHTFAINFLRNGGDLFELQELMGHEDPTILRRYVKYAAQDLAQAHRKASPADRMKLR